MKLDITKISEYFGDKQRRSKILIALGILGVLLIMISDMLPEKKANVPASSEKAVQSEEGTDSYRISTQLQLKQLLQQIDGVGRCDVMLTLEGTTEYVYAENISRYTDSGGGKTSDKYDNSIVFAEKDGDKHALVKKVIKPQISGVVVVCEGGGDIRVKERVIKAVSTVLDISSAKVCVEAKK